MTVIKRGKSYWIDVGFNHHRFRKRSPDNTYKGAKAYELVIRQKLARGQPLDDVKAEMKYTFRETALQWLEVYVKNNNKQSEITNRYYILKSCLIPYFGKIHIDEITSYHIEKYKGYLLKKRGLSPKSINNRLWILSRCLKSAVEWEMTKNVPMIKVLKVPPQKYDYLTETEAEKLLTYANGQWNDMILLAVRTGLRFGELIALRWKDINLEEKILNVNRSIVRSVEGSPKSNKSRTVPLTSSVMQMLKNRDHDCEYIFHDRKGQPLKHDFCQDNLHEICIKAGLRKIGWHSLRHSFASHLAAKHNSIVAIKELLGHSDIKTTMRYAHVNLPVLQNTIDSLEPDFQINGTIASQLPNRGLESDYQFALNLQNSLEKNEKLDINPVSRRCGADGARTNK
jgi:integrase